MLFEPNDKIRKKMDGAIARYHAVTGVEES